MSIVADENTRVVIQGGPAGVNAARRMAEFSYLIKKPFNVRAFVFPPDAGKTVEIPFGSETLVLPIFATIQEATKAYPDINASLVYIAPNRALESAMEALKSDRINLVSMITEGVTEKDAKILAHEA
ncbi:MAG: ATP citrate lyase, partial [Nitrospirae bacterium]|nr:ATP citrate lyase [Nitrospirota bacterium]